MADALILDGDRDLLWSIEAALCGEEDIAVARENAAQDVANDRERCEQAARDAVARQAFSAGCEYCAAGRGIEPYTPGDPHCWHPITDEDQGRFCRSYKQRLALDPEGRLAGARHDPLTKGVENG